MFGYVKPVPGELLVREYDFYRAVYCGVCRAMQRHTGRLSACALTYDSVFYALVRMMLTDAPCQAHPFRCAVHPCKTRQCLEENAVLEDTARAFAVLAYGKACDACQDRGPIARLPLLLPRGILRRAARRAERPELLALMQQELRALDALEKAACPSVDQVADCTGRMLGAFFAYGLPEGKAQMAYAIGLHLGRFVAVADAAEDHEEDKRHGNYNPYHQVYPQGLDDAAREQIYLALTAELCALEEALLRLPHETYPAAGQILKNILYLGLPARIRFLRHTGAEKEKETE